ncbi:MAG: Gfo/Idh/MocA family oxidoreductase [Planctomycetia bacterium]|nr:Gfo/Idh/MocA family oxidoreductase [Planctomycetia bacterium]
MVTGAVAMAVPHYIPRECMAQGDRPGANDRIGIAAIGIGRQGSGVFAAAAGDPRTTPVAICDVWLKRAMEQASKHRVPEDSVYQDYRRVIDRGDVDAIVTATPEHWRCMICVPAALAGKHLYVEKPITLTIEDGRLMRAAARRTNIRFQCGSMQRSYVANWLGCQLIREGGIGEILEVYAANYESPWYSNLPAEPVPEGLDWDMWCGPTEPVPYHSQLFTPRGNPGWLSFRPWSGGEMTGWGTHGFDQIQCALGMDDTGPVEVMVEGDKLEPPTYDRPESSARGNQLCSRPQLSWRYANGLIVRLDEKVNRGGGLFVGGKGKVEIFRGRVTSNPKELAEEYLRSHADLKLPSHMTNWIDCIYNGERPVGDIETGIRTATICHILNIARYLGRNLTWDPVSEVFVGDDEANTMISRPHRRGYEQPVVT